MAALMRRSCVRNGRIYARRGRSFLPQQKALNELEQQIGLEIEEYAREEYVKRYKEARARNPSSVHDNIDEYMTTVVWHIKYFVELEVQRRFESILYEMRKSRRK